MSSDASFYLWNSNCHELLLSAQDSGANIHLDCCCMWQGEPTCMKLEGLLREVNGREAQFFVRGVSLQAQSPKIEVGNGTFYFSINRQIAEDTTARVGVYGTGNILETVVGPAASWCTCACGFRGTLRCGSCATAKEYPGAMHTTGCQACCSPKTAPTPAGPAAASGRTYQIDSG